MKIRYYHGIGKVEVLDENENIGNARRVFGVKGTNRNNPYRYVVKCRALEDYESTSKKHAWKTGDIILLPSRLLWPRQRRRHKR